LSVCRLFLDEDAAQHGLLAALRVRNVEVTSAQESGLIGAADRVQLNWCQSEGRVLYPFNVRHFYALHSEYMAAGKNHAGIILAPQQRYSIGEQMRRVLHLVTVRSAEDMHDRVEYLSHW